MARGHLNPSALVLSQRIQADTFIKVQTYCCVLHMFKVQHGRAQECLAIQRGAQLYNGELYFLQLLSVLCHVFLQSFALESLNFQAFCESLLILLLLEYYCSIRVLNTEVKLQIREPFSRTLCNI